MGDVDYRIRDRQRVIKELKNAPRDVWHMAGVCRCTVCGEEQFALQQVPIWAVAPGSGECPSCGKMACLFLDDGEPTADGGVCELVRVMPDER